jgi:phage tail-like protein
MEKFLEYWNHPLPVYNFRVFIFPRLKANSEQYKIADLLLFPFMAFVSIDGLSQERDSVRYYHGKSWKTGSVTQLGMYKPLNLTLKRGIAPARFELSDWFQDGGEARDLEIHLCDEFGIPCVRWKVYNAVPTKIDAPSFSAASNELAIEQINLIADSFRVEYLYANLI